MPETTSEHWLLEYAKGTAGVMAPTIEKSARFSDKETAKEAGEMLVGLDNYRWGPLDNDYYEPGERLMVHDNLIRVRRDSDEIHHEGEIPDWCESEKRSRERRQREVEEWRKENGIEPADPNPDGEPEGDEAYLESDGNY